jgi:hypothetical protein
MATRATFARLTQNLRKFRKANVIFFKKGFGKCVHFGEYHLRALGKYNEYGENGKYGEYLPNRLANVGESGESQHFPFLGHFVLPIFAKFAKFPTSQKLPLKNCLPKCCCCGFFYFAPGFSWDELFYL